MAEPGLRERKKAKLRAQVVEAADNLFLQHGFDAVTLDDVAVQCDVSVRTVLRYFPSKEALALAYERDMLERFRTGLAKRRGDVLGYWRYHVGMNSAAFGARADWHRQRYQMLRDLPLYVALVGIRDEYQRLLATALVEEAGGGSELAPELLAAMLVAGNDYVLRKFLNDEADFEPDSLLEVIDFSTELFAKRLDAAG